MRNKKGFTLVELLIAIAIIAILAAVIGMNVFEGIEKSKVASAKADVKAIKNAALLYYADMGFFPISVGRGKDPGFMALVYGEGLTDVQKITLDNNWNGPYLDMWPSKTPWGGVYDWNLWSQTKIVEINEKKNKAKKEKKEKEKKDNYGQSKKSEEPSTGVEVDDETDADISLPAGLYVGIVPRTEGSNIGSIPRRTEQLLFDEGFDTDQEPDNGEILVLLARWEDFK